MAVDSLIKTELAFITSDRFSELPSLREKGHIHLKMSFGILSRQKKKSLLWNKEIKFEQ